MELSFQDFQMAAFAPTIAYRGEVSEGSRVMTTQLPHFTWWYLERGPARVTFSGRQIDLEPGTMILFPRDFRRSHRFEAASRLLSISFEAFWASSRPCFQFEYPIMTRGESAELLRRRALDVCRFLKGEKFSAQTLKLAPESWSQFYAAFLRWLSTLTDWLATEGVEWADAKAGDGRLEAILGELRDHPRAGPLPYPDWQRRYGCGRSQLDRLAMAILGNTLRAYRDRQLIESVRLRVQRGDASMKELAAEYGFTDNTHFSRWMRRQTGVSPSQWRVEQV